ncbi:MAG: transposase [Desulfuromonadales bacterium]|nr:transposase [Desulfuromonadales bacterium]
MKELLKRKQNRLQNYDYSQNGAYFVTICIKDKHELLWIPAFVGAHSVRPLLSDIGKVVEKAIMNIPQIYETVIIDRYTIMPNHVHMIAIIDCDHGRTLCAPTISRVIKQCKEYVTKQIGYSIWQKSFHDHIIRNEQDYINIAEYIENNPANWEIDRFFVVANQS